VPTGFGREGYPESILNLTRESILLTLELNNLHKPKIKSNGSTTSINWQEGREALTCVG
jgi:hypothetical protein